MSSTDYASHLDLFVDLVRQGSFSAVARKRQLAVSSVVRRIDALETQLACTLFIRSTRALQLTESGKRLAARAAPLVNALVDLRGELADLEQSPAGLLRIGCPPAFGRRHVLPVVAKMLESHPGLHIELDLSERPMKPIEERLDALIRVGALPDSGLFASPVGQQRWCLCAAPAYLQRSGRPLRPDDLAAHSKIGKLHELPGWGWSRFPASLNGAGEKRLCCDDFEAQRLAALAGLGIACLPNWLVDDDIDTGALQNVLADADATADPIHLLRPLPSPSRKLQRFTEALRTRLERHGV
jgi:DNA-binding transcriptional LysR family regulator